MAKKPPPPSGSETGRQTGEKHKKNPKENRGLSDEDQGLWAYVLRDVLPLPGKRAKPVLDAGDHTPARAASPVPAPPQSEVAPASAPTPAPPPRMDLSPGSGLDRRNANRLRKGQMVIEGRLDLHGLRQAEAQTRLTQFLLSAHAAGKRCVLVITGKGNSKMTAAMDDGLPGWMRNEPGVLRQNLPLWLRQDPLRAIVLEMSAATPRDGGSGAFYILLRRERG
ncbi:Smr domain protein [Micavibrio aeruginosavorus EPB]|uniref:Smr domain protein n=1 Tax=Micavibrio aeruginosavorus EPB TaxID=349215 RepID=M4VBU8_9BACT|nr:Smr domain protein [Micavibrio aeruginosavorus EPB]